jgi:hypothetical protein
MKKYLHRNNKSRSIKITQSPGYIHINNAKKSCNLNQKIGPVRESKNLSRLIKLKRKVDNHKEKRQEVFPEGSHIACTLC